MRTTSRSALRRVAAGASAAALAVTFGTALATGASAAEGTADGSGDHVSWTRTVSDTNPHVGDKITVTNTLSGTEESYTPTKADVASVLGNKIADALDDTGYLNGILSNLAVSGSVPKYITAMDSGLGDCFTYVDGSATITQGGSDLTGWTADLDGAITDSNNDLQVSTLSGATPLTWTADYTVTCDPGTSDPSVSGTVDYAISIDKTIDNPLYYCKWGLCIGDPTYTFSFDKTITDTAFATATGPAITVRDAISASLGVDPAPQAGEESTLTATVDNADEGDTVTFTNNGDTIGTATLSGSTASITWTPDADAGGDSYSLVATVDDVASDAVTGTIADAEDTGGTDPGDNPGGDDNPGDNGNDGNGGNGGDNNDDGDAGLFQSLQSLQALFG